jgi:hypothetical protein
MRICISLLSKRTYDRALGRRIRLVEVLAELIVCADLIRKVSALQAGFPAYPTHDSRHDALIISQQQEALTTTCYQSLYVRWSSQEDDIMIDLTCDRPDHMLPT